MRMLISSIASWAAPRVAAARTRDFPVDFAITHQRTALMWRGTNCVTRVCVGQHLILVLRTHVSRLLLFFSYIVLSFFTFLSYGPNSTRDKIITAINWFEWADSCRPEKKTQLHQVVHPVVVQNFRQRPTLLSSLRQSNCQEGRPSTTRTNSRTKVQLSALSLRLRQSRTLMRSPLGST